MKEIPHYDESTDSLIIETRYDNNATLEANKIAINSAPEFGRYKGTLVHVGRIDEGDVVRLYNNGYNLLSPDREERKRCLLYIQRNEPHLLTVPGKPFAKKKLTWQ